VPPDAIRDLCATESNAAHRNVLHCVRCAATCCTKSQLVVLCCNVLGRLATTLSGICAPWSGILRGRADSDRLHRSKERVAVQSDPTHLVIWQAERARIKVEAGAVLLGRAAARCIVGSRLQPHVLTRFACRHARGGPHRPVTSTITSGMGSQNMPYESTCLTSHECCQRRSAQGHQRAQSRCRCGRGHAVCAHMRSSGPH
jgi:hypothetical protein